MVRPAVDRRAGAAPVRLTRRGRIVLGVVIAALATVLIAVLAAGPAGGVARSGQHQPGRAGFQGMRQVVVQPGQSLWSIAAAAEPAADPRAVIQQIVAANALDGDSVQAGQLLWVPRR